MDFKEKEYRKLKLGLAFKKCMESYLGDPVDKEGSKSLSFRKLGSSSGIRHASIVEIVNGKKNAAWSTIDAILEGLEITLTIFASVYDNLSEIEILEYKKVLEKKKQERKKKRK